MTATVEISKRLILVNSMSAATVHILRLTVLMWMYQYLLKRIHHEEFAVYVLVTTVIAFAPLFSSFFTSGISRYVVEAWALGDERRARQIISAIIPFMAGWGVLFVAGGWSLALNISSVLTISPEHLSEAQLMMGLLISDFTFQMIMTPFAVGFHVRQRFHLLNLIQIGVELFRIGLLFTLLFAVSTRVVWVVVATTSSNVLLVTVTTLVSRRLVPALRFSPALFQWQAARQLISFGLWTTIGQLAYMIYMNIDILLLNKLSTASEVTVFKLGSEFYNQIQSFVGTAVSPIRPALTAIHARQSTEKIGEAFVRGGRYALWVTLLIACPVFVYRRELITLYVGKEYLEAATVAAMLLCLFPFTQSSFFLAPVAAATARIRSFSLVTLIVQLVKLAVSLYAVNGLRLGAVGCAMSTLVVIGLAHLFVFWPMALSMTGVRLRQYLYEVLVRGLLPAVIGFAVWTLLNMGMRPMSWGAMGFNVMVGGFAYLVVLFLLSASDGDRRDMLVVWHALTRNQSWISRL